jgi:hypothetical protein
MCVLQRLVFRSRVNSTWVMVSWMEQGMFIKRIHWPLSCIAIRLYLLGTQRCLCIMMYIAWLQLDIVYLYVHTYMFLFDILCVERNLWRYAHTEASLASPPFIFCSVTDNGLTTIAFTVKQVSSHLRGVVATSENILRAEARLASVWTGHSTHARLAEARGVPVWAYL